MTKMGAARIPSQRTERAFPYAPPVFSRLDRTDVCLSGEVV